MADDAAAFGFIDAVDIVDGLSRAAGKGIDRSPLAQALTAPVIVCPNLFDPLGLD